jgi:F420H(2)-dependent quinone reductase
VTDRYRKGPWIQRRIGVPMVRMLLRRFGVKIGTAQVLEVADPASGEVHSTPLHVLELDGVRYLVSARGESSWARSLRAAGRARLTRGRTTEEVAAVELPDAEKPPILGAYVKGFWKDSKDAFALESPDAGEDELRAIAPQHPVFRLTRPDA